MAPPSEPNISGNSGGPSISTPKIDGGQTLAKLTKMGNALKTALDGVDKSLKAIEKSGTKAAKAVKEALGNSYSNDKNGSSGSNTNYSLPEEKSGGTAAAGGGRMARMGGMAKGAGKAAFGAATAEGMGSAIGSVIGNTFAAMDSRIARGYAYSSGADKMTVMYQQITGMSNAGVREAYRQPLTNYRLGTGGINTLMGMQASTGIKALGQASTVEGMNALSGYSLGAQGVANMVTNFGSAETANRMFMTTGMSLYKPGGGQRSGTEVVQNLAKASGLTGLKNIEGALQQGSNTRARLADMGVDSATQDIVIQYAMANQQYGAKGGKGMYDPSNKGQRKMVGIEDNFSTQIEETTRVKTDREEDFYGRQQDNFAGLEKATQSLEKMFGSLEDKLSTIIGAGIKSKPHRNMMGGLLKGLGPVLSAVGMGVAVLTAPTGVGPAIGMGMMAAGAAATAAGSSMDSQNPSESSSGDPGPGRNLPTMGRTGDPKPSGGSGLHPTMKGRLDKLIAASGGKVGIGQGYRSSAQQEAMFRSRYRKTTQAVDSNGKKNWIWDGSYWEHVSGAQAAPPGRSMHEIGLAADLTGDLNWVAANAARFGLKTFGGVNAEPWHVQPAELPNGRQAYEQAGSPWGGAKMPPSTGVQPTFSEHADRVSGGGGGISGLGSSGVTTASFSGMSMADAMAAFRAGGALGSTGLSGGTGSPRRRGGGVSTTPTKQGGQLSGEDVARYAYNAGFRGENLVNVVGISHRESRWNAGAYNPNAKTKDLSFGLMQINMLGTLGPARLKQFGLSKNEDLYDPATNMRAAFIMSGGKDFYAWGGYKGKDNTYNTDLDMARQVVTKAGLLNTGDPDMRPMSRGGGGTSISTLTTGATFNISPVININGSANPHVDAQVIAHEVTMIIEREMRMRSMRSA